MTVQSQVSSITYTGDNTTKIFAYPFRILVDTDLRVLFTDSNGVVTTKILNVDYTVSNVNNISGGNVTFIVAPPTGIEVFIARLNELYLQLMSLLPNSMFDLASLEQQLDRFALQDQQLDLKINGIIGFPYGKLPSNRQNKILCFDSNSNLSLTLNIPNTILGFDNNGVINYQVYPFANFPANRQNKIPYFDGNGNVQVTLNTPNTVLGFNNSGQIQYNFYPFANFPTTGYQNKIPYFDANSNVQLTSNVANTVLGFDANGKINYQTMPSAPSGMFTQAGIGAIPWTYELKNRQIISVKDFGAIGDGVTDDTTAIQNAIISTPFGGELNFRGKFLITKPLIINQPIRITGTGIGSKYSISQNTCYIKQSVSTNPIFKLTANINVGTFNAAIAGVIINNITLMGNSNSDRCLAAITTDTTVGSYTLSDCHFYNLNILYCQTGIDINAIFFENYIYYVSLNWCNTAINFQKQTSALPDNMINNVLNCVKTQNCNNGINLNSGFSDGYFALYNCIIQQSTIGILTSNLNSISIRNCSFFANQNNTNGIDVLFTYLSQNNLNIKYPIEITHNTFLASDNAIMINTSNVTANNLISGNISGIIDNNYFNGSGKFLSYSGTIPYFITNDLIVGKGNYGLTGQLPNSTFNPNLIFNDQRYSNYIKKIYFNTNNQILGVVPNKSQIKSIRIWINTLAAIETILTVNVTINGVSSIISNSISLKTTTINQWFDITAATLGSTGDAILSIANSTGSLNGATGYIEYQYYTYPN